MTPKEKLIFIQNNKYEDEDGDIFGINLLSGLTESELKLFAERLPSQKIPTEIRDLLILCKGFTFQPLEEVRFDAFEVFGFEEIFPYSIQLAGDGFGNFWILDIDGQGNWNCVYYVCHDPAVIVKHSENLSDFISHVDEFGFDQINSHLNIIHDRTVFEIYEEKVGILERNDKDYPFEKSIKVDAPYLIADLKDLPVKSGFRWDISGSRTKILRPSDEPIWVIEKSVKQNLLSRLFNLKK